MSVDIMAGFTGRTSLCHGAIFGVATYVVLHYVTVVGGSVWLGALLGILAAMLISMIFAALAIRTSGVYFILLTLALGMIVWGVCLRWTSVTGGENGIRGSVAPEWLLNKKNCSLLCRGHALHVEVCQFTLWPDLEGDSRQ